MDENERSISRDLSFDTRQETGSDGDDFPRERTRRNSSNIGESLVPVNCLSVRMSGKSLGDSGSIQGAGYLAEQVE